MELTELLCRRRSIRKYTGEHIGDGQLAAVLQAGLLAPSGSAIYPVELIAVRERGTLQKLSECKSPGAAMLSRADAAVIVIGDRERSDVWIEDGAITMTLMLLKAEELGLGGCWVQCRGRSSAQGVETEAAVRALMHIPERFGVLAILSLGVPAERPPERPIPAVTGPKLHYEDYTK